MGRSTLRRFASVKASTVKIEDDVSPQEAFQQALASRSALWPDIRTEHLPIEPGWVSAAAFFADDAVISEFLVYAASFNAGTDLKSAAAFMMTDYGYIFSSAIVPLFVGFDIVPDLDPSGFALHFHEVEDEHDGKTIRIRRAHVRYLAEPSPAPMDRAARQELFRRGIEAHYKPLIDMLHAKTGLPRRAMWRLATDSIAGRFLDAGRRYKRLDQAMADAMAVLGHPGSPLHNRQMHFFDLSVLDREQREVSYTFRQRGGCCRYYLVEGGNLCSTCVLEKPERRDDRLRRAMRKHLGVPVEDDADDAHDR